MKLKNNSIFVVFMIIILICLDLFTKYFFIDKYFCDNCLIFIHGTNNFGSSFGIFSSFNYYSFFVGILSIIFVVAFILKRKYFINNFYLRWSYVFLISGVLGNAYDRFVFYSVRDFIGIKSFFIFNIADAFIFLGVFFYLIYEFKKSYFFNKFNYKIR